MTYALKTGKTGRIPLYFAPTDTQMDFAQVTPLNHGGWLSTSLYGLSLIALDGSVVTYQPPPPPGQSYNLTGPPYLGGDNVKVWYSSMVARTVEYTFSLTNKTFSAPKVLSW